MYCHILECKNNAYFSFWCFYVKIEICWKWPNTEGIINAWSTLYGRHYQCMEYTLSQNYWNFVCLFMRNESENNQGVKLKNHKFWSVNSPTGAEFCLASKLMPTLSSTLNNISETSSRIFSIANSLQTKFCSFMQIWKVSNFRDSIR